MKAAFVLDCSVAMTWLFKDEATEETAALLNRLASEAALVPAWWFVEVTSVLALAERRRRITRPESEAFIANLSSLDFETDDAGPSRAFTQLLRLCREHRLTAYDAIYLDLALRRGLPLATLNRDLRRASRRLGIAVLGR